MNDLEISKNKESIEGFKSVLNMMHDASGIYCIASKNYEKALILVKANDKSNDDNIYYSFDSNSHESAELNIFGVSELPITNNYVAIEGSSDNKMCYITILDKDTLDRISSVEFKTDKRAVELYNSIYLKKAYAYNVNNHGYFGLTLRLIDESFEVNIHGDYIGLDGSYSKLRDSTFISLKQEMVKVYDNIEDMRLLKIVKLDTYGGLLKYYPILNNRQKECNGKQVVFIYATRSSNIYAYDLDDKVIYKVDDTRETIDVEYFIDKLRECLNTTDNERKNDDRGSLHNLFNDDIDKQKEYEKKQFELDCNALRKDIDNMFKLNTVHRGNKLCLVYRSIMQCIAEYQYNYNKVKIIYNTDDKHVFRNYNDFLNYIEIGESPTPYRVKSLKMFNSEIEAKLRATDGKLRITYETIEWDELLSVEGLE